MSNLEVDFLPKVTLRECGDRVILQNERERRGIENSSSIAIFTNDGYRLKIPKEISHVKLPVGSSLSEGPIEFSGQRRKPRVNVSGTMRLGKSTLVSWMGEYFRSFGFSVAQFFEETDLNPHLAIAYANPTSKNILTTQLKFLELKKSQQKQALKEKRKLRVQDVAPFNDWVYAYVNTATGRLSPGHFGVYRDAYWVAGLDLEPAPDLLIHLTTLKDEVVLQRTKSNARGIEVGLTPDYYLGLKAVTDEMVGRMHGVNRMVIHVDEVDFSPNGDQKIEVGRAIASNLVGLGWDEYKPAQ